MSREEKSAGAAWPISIPPRFLERMAAALGDEFAQFAAIYAAPPVHGLRVNTLKLTPPEFQAIAPFDLTPIPWSPAGFLIADESRPGKHPYHAAGLYYLQDPHAQAAAEILAPQPGERVLDLAAAPGGKTTHLASRMQGEGLLVANEIKTKRIGHLISNLERWGVRNAAITNETPERLAEFFGPFFDRVLVDAPCSGEGMFRKDRAAREDWSEEMIAGCALRQAAILHYAARLVRPGGWLCYSTCTFAPEEDETVVANFLAEHRDFELAQTEGRHLPQAFAGSPAMLRLWPHHSPGEGHFIALLRRSAHAPGRPAEAHPPAHFAGSLPRPVQTAWNAWCAQNLTAPLPVAPVLWGSRLYALPEALPDLHGLRALHPGWWLGEVKKDRIEPSHALALALKASEARQVLALPFESPHLLQYLRCETFQSAGEDGWTLAALAAPLSAALPPAAPALTPAVFPLGWGKRVKGVLKNHYPRGLMWL